MAQRILLIESDPVFADEVKTNFEAMGASVEVAEDGPTGIASAEQQRPDLILLTIELKGMNGFLVCKKIKKNEDLANVPLIILSSDTLEESFEQHKKLRIRAEEYLRKPIAFDSLLLSVNHFVDLQGEGDLQGEIAEFDEEPLELEDDEMVMIAEDDDFEDALSQPIIDDFGPASGAAGLASTPPEPVQPMSSLPPPLHSTPSSAPRPRMSSAPPVAARMQSSPPVAKRMSTTPPLGEVTSEEVEALQEQLGNLLEQRALLQRELDEALARVAQLEEMSERSAEEQRSSAGSVEKEAAQRQILEREVQQLRGQVEQLIDEREQANGRAQAAEEHAKSVEARAAEGKQGGSSNREALDLRDQLNRKEREVLELRSQMASRDKQLLEANERALEVERSLADLREEHTLALRAHEEQRTHSQALVSDLKEATRHLGETKTALEQQAAAHREAISALETSHQMVVDELREEATQAAQAAKALLDSQVQTLQEQLAEEELRKREIQSSLQEVRHERDRLQAEVTHHQEVAERVRKAMAIGLGLLDEDQANGRSANA